MTDIAWRRTDGDDALRTTAVDIERCRRITPDVDGDVGASVAKTIVETVHAEEGWGDLGDGNGPIVEIVSPEFAGVYAVAMSRNNRRGVLGTSARRLMPSTEAEARQAALSVQRFLTDPDAVENSYAFLGNVYGHEIDDPDGDPDDPVLEIIRARYDDCTFHDRGWPVKSRLTGEIGILLSHRESAHDTPPDEIARMAFHARHGVFPQPVTRWNGDDVAMTVAFVPAELFDRFGEIADEFVALVREAAAPAPSGP